MSEMKYKVGDKFLVEITGINDTSYPYELSEVGIAISEKALDKLRRPDDMTAEEAWEIARKLFLDFSESELNEIFGENWSYPRLMRLSPQQFKTKIEAWEPGKDIKVGDVVFYLGANKNCIVTCTNNKGYMYMVDENGIYHTCSDKTCLKNTGKHIDIKNILEQIGE